MVKLHGLQSPLLCPNIQWVQFVYPFMVGWAVA